MKPITIPNISIPTIGIPTIGILTIGYSYIKDNKPRPDPPPDGRYLLLSDGTPLLSANEEPILLADNKK